MAAAQAIDFKDLPDAEYRKIIGACAARRPARPRARRGRGVHGRGVQRVSRAAQRNPSCTRDMVPSEMSNEATEIITMAVDKYVTNGNYEAMSKMIKEAMDKKYGPQWHCAIGGASASTSPTSSQT
ncbi:hypothetical protein JL720_5220 [Aureococcus anophagefferens]|nr:hypothetical protein JL720_5220 [Aureococcus anophagefferens]